MNEIKTELLESIKENAATYDRSFDDARFKASEMKNMDLHSDEEFYTYLENSDCTLVDNAARALGISWEEMNNWVCKNI